MNNKIVIIGYRATGKSSVSALLGERLGLPVVDTDAEVERTAGKTIAEIFAGEGEPAFRDKEAAAVAATIARAEPLVISTGGGAILREESRRLLRGSGRVFWLTASRETIYYRMHSDATNSDRRPPLTDLSPLLEIESVLNFRNPIYQETAHYKIDTENKTIDRIVDEIIQNINERNE